MYRYIDKQIHRYIEFSLLEFSPLEFSPLKFSLLGPHQCIFSPGEHLFLTGTSVRKNKDGTPAGQSILHVYDKSTLQLVRKEGVPSGYSA